MDVTAMTQERSHGFADAIGDDEAIETHACALSEIRSTLVGSYMLSLTSAMRATRREHGRIFHATALLIAALCMAACAGSAPHAPIAMLDTSPTAQSALRSILLSGKSGSESGASSQANPVLAFYQSRNFAP